MLDFGEAVPDLRGTEGLILKQFIINTHIFQLIAALVAPQTNPQLFQLSFGKHLKDPVEIRTVGNLFFKMMSFVIARCFIAIVSIKMQLARTFVFELHAYQRIRHTMNQQTQQDIYQKKAAYFFHV